jgi:large subunit ribosomal protein L25
VALFFGAVMEFVVELKNEQGSSASRRLRRAGRVPAIVYGANTEPVFIHLDHNEIFHSYRKEAFKSSVLTLKVGNKSLPVVLQAIQKHPYKPLVMHLDFHLIDENAKLTKKVPIVFEGEEISPAIKLSSAIINHVMHEIEISCLPKDLPAHITVDLSSLAVGHSLHAADIKYPAGVTPVLHGKNPVLATAIIPAAEAAQEAATAPAAE